MEVACPGHNEMGRGKFVAQYLSEHSGYRAGWLGKTTLQYSQRKLIQGEICAEVEEARFSRMVGMVQAGGLDQVGSLQMMLKRRSVSLVPQPGAASSRQRPSKYTITFVRAREIPQILKKTQGGLLATAKDR